jgi:curved DNA-binding protein CbpA
MNNTEILDKKGMTRKEALAILGLKESHTKEDLKKRYRLLAKLYHPDKFPMSENPTPKELEDKAIRDLKILEINEAIATLKKQNVRPPTIKDKDVLGYIKILKELAPLGLATEDKLLEKYDEIYGKLAGQEEFRNDPIKDEKLRLAYKKFLELRDSEQRFLNRARSIPKRDIHKRLYYLGLPKDLQEQYDMYEELKLIAARQNIDHFFTRFNHLMNKVIFKAKRAYVPIKSKNKKKSYVKYIKLTMALLVAILSGKYIWDKTSYAFKLRRSSKNPIQIAK